MANEEAESLSENVRAAMSAAQLEFSGVIIHDLKHRLDAIHMLNRQLERMLRGVAPERVPELLAQSDAQIAGAHRDLQTWRDLLARPPVLRDHAARVLDLGDRLPALAQECGRLLRAAGLKLEVSAETGLPVRGSDLALRHLMQSLFLTLGSQVRARARGNGHTLVISARVAEHAVMVRWQVSSGAAPRRLGAFGPEIAASGPISDSTDLERRMVEALADKGFGGWVETYDLALLRIEIGFPRMLEGAA